MINIRQERGELCSESELSSSLQATRRRFNFSSCPKKTLSVQFSALDFRVCVAPEHYSPSSHSLLGLLLVLRAVSSSSSA